MIDKLNKLILTARKNKDKELITIYSYVKSLFEENKKSKAPIEENLIIPKYLKKLNKAIKKIPEMEEAYKKEVEILTRLLDE